MLIFIISLASNNPPNNFSDLKENNRTIQAVYSLKNTAVTSLITIVTALPNYAQSNNS